MFVIAARAFVLILCTFTPALALDEGPGLTPENVVRLTSVLTFPMEQSGGYGGAVQAAGGLVFVQTPFPHRIYALDPARPGNPVRWSVAPASDRMASGQDCCGTVAGPVLDGSRLYLNTFDGHTLALDASTGAVLWDVQTAQPSQGETLPGAPLVADGTVFVGSGGEDFGGRGWIEALEAGTGRSLWRKFNTGPDGEVGIGPGGEPDLGVASWPPEAWRQGGGGASGLAFDAAFGALIHSTGHPAPWNPDQRDGENRWTSGLFARDAASGAVRWFLPVNPHDQYALGAGPSNLLVDLGARKLLVHPDGNGRVYVIDRSSGKLLSAAAFVPTNASTGVDLETGLLQRNDGKSVSVNSTTRDICPGWPGATGPGAAGFSAATRLLYIPANLLCMDMEGRNTSYVSGTPYMGANLRMKAQPGQSRGALIAWDIGANKAAWTVPEPFPVAGGVLVTAGGVVFYGTLDGWLKAVDARSGRSLWQARTASGIIGTPTAFHGADGRQYLAVLAGVGGVGRVAWRGIDVRDATAAHGYANALRDLPQQTTPGGALHLFALPP
ncbi:MAG: PQQ-binding-like beta-propeller repeat protein [Acetobacteraceae bacterium]|nr:PQQ-binding-like beta-propeller repeat protein [Acetobacteraceae bacterium]